MDTTIRAQEAIPARIDRLPLSREIWGIMLLAGVAWLVESYDVGVIGSVLPSLQKEFQLGALSVGLLAIASTLGIVIGVIPAGWMADTIGRKKILITGTAWYSVFSLLCGFAPTPTALVLLRFASGLGVLDFLKRTSLLKLGSEQLRALSEPAITLAEAEGLQAHARSVAIRLNR